MKWQSNAQWPLEVYRHEDGSGISTDIHHSESEARTVCTRLEREGFGGRRLDFPIKTWVSQIAAKGERDGCE